MKIDLLYGREGITVDVSDDIEVTVVQKHSMPLLPDPVQAVWQALKNPVESLRASSSAI
jgi:hypothetical protein